MPYLLKHRRPPESWKTFRGRTRHRILVPFLATEFAAEWISFGLSRWSFLEVLEYAGSFSILIAVIFYFAEKGERIRASHYQAWQVINTAAGHRGSGGRIEALQSLNDDHVSLVGVDLSKADLQGLQLDGANLLRAYFGEADLRNANLANADLEIADFKNANLRHADLQGADLSNADLGNTDLSEVDVRGANFEKADLTSALLTNFANWKDATSWEGAQIADVEDAPEGFVEWAVKHGAVSKGREGTVKPTSVPATKPSAAAVIGR